MNQMIAQAGLADQINCDSAGTAGYHIGSPPDARMRSALRQRGIPTAGQARQFKPLDLDEFDLILAMDRENYQDILAWDSTGEYRSKIKMMCDYAKSHDDREVPDPYYGGPEGFEYVIDLLSDACANLLQELKQQLPAH